MESFEIHANYKINVGFCFFFKMNAYVLVIMPLCNETQQTQDLRGKQNKNEIFYSILNIVQNLRCCTSQQM